jgi:hypothetical protein
MLHESASRCRYYAMVENPRLIKVGDKIINPDYVANARKDKIGDVVVAFPDGSTIKFLKGKEADSIVGQKVEESAQLGGHKVSRWMVSVERK